MTTRIHINRVRYSRTECMTTHCPTCDRMRRMSAQWAEWYGWKLTCAGCGETWSDGEMHVRPFAPGWRRENREHARAVLAGIGVRV
jgi:hypothetical protein